MGGRPLGLTLPDWISTPLCTSLYPMFAPNFSNTDLERVGPIIESLLDSGKLTDEERYAVDLCGRAATDLALIKHSEVAIRFYGRPDIESQTADSVAAWLSEHPDAEPGTVTSVAGRMHVASIGSDGKLQLSPLVGL